MSPPPSLPIERRCILSVEWTGHLRLRFDDPAEGVLEVDGPFELHTGAQRDLFDPPFPEWVADVVATLVGVEVTLVRWRRSGQLRVVFADARELHIPDGPFENWHFRNRTGLALHGGVGRVAVFAPTKGL